MLYVLLILFVVVPIITALLKSPENRGKIGESKVKLVIGSTIENKKYVINNLIINNNGKTTQIDHIVINNHGVFVIETKNYSGRIYGSESQQEWTQVLNYGKVKNKLYNPIKQNATHAYHVQKIVGNLPVYSLIVFVKNNTHFIDANNVIPLSALRRRLNCGDNVLNQSQMQSAYHALLNKKSDITNQEHTNNVKKQLYNLEHGICPRCGGKLVLRNGKYGQFWGCSNYPKCKFKKNN